jgi:EmrB/QacA subfamily drug resistance transporter
VLVPESRDPEKSRLDPLGAVLSTAGLGVLTWSIIEAAERGWTDGIVLGGFVVAVVALAGFVAWELRTASPMLDVRLFRVRRFSGASVSIALVFFSLFGAIYFLTVYLQSVMDFDAFDAGLRVTPVAIGLVLGGPLSAKLAGRLGTRNVVAGGLVVVAAALLLLTGADADSGYGIVAASLVLLGFGMGTTMAPATESIMSSLPLAHAGVGSAMNDTVRMVGGTLGVAVLGSLLSSRYGADMEGAVEGLPAPAAKAAGESVGHAEAVAEQVGGSAGATLERVAETAFSSAMGTTLTVAAGVALAGAMVALLVLPGRERERVEKTALATEPVAA